MWYVYEKSGRMVMSKNKVSEKTVSAFPTRQTASKYLKWSNRNRKINLHKKERE